MIKFRIVDVNHAERQITVRFFSDLLPESELVAEYAADGRTPIAYRTDYAITVPIPAPEGPALAAFIMQYCPVEWFNLRHAVLDPATPTPMPIVAVGQVVDGTPPPAAPKLTELKAAKNDEINAWRASANLSTFPFAGKLFSCDTLSRSDIDAVANHIGLFGTFPEGFPGGWKAVDNSILPLPNVDSFRALFSGMAAQGTENFNYSQQLKQQLESAKTAEAVAAIQW